MINDISYLIEDENIDRIYRVVIYGNINKGDIAIMSNRVFVVYDANYINTITLT